MLDKFNKDMMDIIFNNFLDYIRLRINRNEVINRCFTEYTNSL